MTHGPAHSCEDGQDDFSRAVLGLDFGDRVHLEKPGDSSSHSCRSVPGCPHWHAPLQGDLPLTVGWYLLLKEPEMYPFV